MSDPTRPGNAHDQTLPSEGAHRQAVADMERFLGVGDRGESLDPAPTLPPALPDPEADGQRRKANNRLRERLQVFNLVVLCFFTTFVAISAYRLWLAPPAPDYTPAGALLASG